MSKREAEDAFDISISNFHNAARARSIWSEKIHNKISIVNELRN